MQAQAAAKFMELRLSHNAVDGSSDLSVNKVLDHVARRGVQIVNSEAYPTNSRTTYLTIEYTGEFHGFLTDTLRFGDNAYDTVEYFSVAIL